MGCPDWYGAALQASAAVLERDVLFIVGCQKSGTTWLAALLNAHPEICCRGEGHFTDITGRLIEHAVRVINELPRLSWKYGTSDTLSAIRLLCDQTFAAYIARCDEPAGIRMVGDKTPESAYGMPLLDALYPGARFVHIIRDGRDGAVSGWSHLQRDGQESSFDGFASYAGYFARAHWKPYIEAARAAGRSFPDRYLEVRYEDLHAAPAREMKRILQFLGVSTDPAEIEHCVEQASFRRLSGGRDRGEENRSSHYRKGVVGDWVRHFDDAAEASFKAAAGSLLDALGYARTPAATPLV